MKTQVALLLLAMLLCMAAPLMAGPIQIGDPSAPGYMTGSNNGYPAPDVFSLHSAGPGRIGLLGSGDPLLSGGLGSEHLIQGGGGPLGPPVLKPVPEPSGLMVMLGAGLFGMAGLAGRKLIA